MVNEIFPPYIHHGDDDLLRATASDSQKVDHNNDNIDYYDGLEFSETDEENLDWSENNIPIFLLNANYIMISHKKEIDCDL